MAFTLLPSAARVASGNAVITDQGGAYELTRCNRIAFLLNVTAAATAAGDTLNVYVQSTIDGGTTWNDFVSFTQVLGNGGAKKFEADWNAIAGPTTALGPPTDATLAAGVKQGPIGAGFRVKWVIASASAPSFTFSLLAQGSKS
jgi:hypothetical protein